ncbi:hypothetical protein LCGC14_0195270 [marine sediment metagenome]|uniref:Uncharacterized protein n=1 Tax=marine sediment metagenome TaxID=412755 RepID=A0A0F9UPX2_9ZZZZ
MDCINCEKPRSEHADSAYGQNHRCKIEGAKIYFNDSHWSGKTMVQIALEANLKPCKCSKYECWDCARENRYKCIDEAGNEFNQHALTILQFDKYKCTNCKKVFMLAPIK